jgi:Protein of unknown function (DUF1573)
MQKITSQLLAIFTLLCLSGSLHAQDVKSLLSRLTTEQKLKALEYFRSVGTNLDREVEDAYNQLNKDGQSKATRYLQAIQPETGKSKPIRTTVKWSRDTINFGAIEEGIVYLDSVVVTNNGARPYQITGNLATCDCAVLYAPSQPVLPGESATVRIQFNSLGKSGKVSTGIILQDNSSPNARSILFVTGTVKSKKTAKKKPWE